jgi:NTP pyrophosphatase (non-canonical NTP hydrolase)
VNTEQKLEHLRDQLRLFANDRDWDQFHSPKNLAMALVVEAGELVEVFQWMTEEQSNSLTPAQRSQASEEIADVLLYLIRIADKLDVSLVDAAQKKIEKNAQKYPAQKVKGSSKKYNAY